MQEPALARTIYVPMVHLPSIAGTDRKNFVQLEQVHRVKISLFPSTESDPLQGIRILGSPAEGSSAERCDDAVDEVRKVSIHAFFTLFCI